MNSLADPLFDKWLIIGLILFFAPFFFCAWGGLIQNLQQRKKRAKGENC